MTMSTPPCLGLKKKGRVSFYFFRVSVDAHVAKKVIGNDKAHVGKMDAILTDSHLDTRIKIVLQYD